MGRRLPRAGLVAGAALLALALAVLGVSHLALLGMPHLALLGVSHRALASGIYPSGIHPSGMYQSSIYQSSTRGYDISWPQCEGAYPATRFDFGIVGVTGGKAYTRNPCLASEYAWARRATASAPSVYMNLNYGLTRGRCARNDTACQAYDYGYWAARSALRYAQAQGVGPTTWWLDVEMENTWSRNTSLNAQVIRGALTYLNRQGLVAGIYSTPYQWAVIAGSYSPGVPNWAGGAPSSSPAAFCRSAQAFGGGSVWLTQYAHGNYDGDFAC